MIPFLFSKVTLCRSLCKLGAFYGREDFLTHFLSLTAQCLSGPHCRLPASYTSGPCKICLLTLISVESDVLP